MKLLAQINFQDLKASAFPTGGEISLRGDLTLGEIISKATNYVFILAGILLLFLLISGGFQMMVGASNPKTQENASKTVTNAILGFLILFISYWVVQIVETVLGIAILK